MANYIDKLMNISPKMAVQNTAEPVLTAKSQPTITVQPIGTNILEQFLANQGIVAATQIVAPVTNAPKEPQVYKNDLRTKFKNNEATIMGVIIRNLGAEDKTGNQLLREGDVRGNFNNAVKRLDEFKKLGINTLHVLPVNPPGKLNAMGTAGSLYAPEDLLKIDPKLADPNDPRDVKEQFKGFIDECHKRGISVMLDLPSCASYDLFQARPDLMAFDKDGTPKTPGGWNDIRMFNPWKDETKRELNPALLQVHKDFVDMCIDLGVDGIRSDVARTKPTEFWDNLITYSRQRDPEFAWLAESYTYEDASPQLNMNYDRPQDCLRAGFDSYYGQYHNFHEWSTASELYDYVKENLDMSQELDAGKSLIGSFGTHDDISIMNHGGVIYTDLVSGLQATLPMLNPYYFDGYQSGDTYMYDFEGQSDSETDTDCNECTVHRSKPDIFNFSRPLIGDHPECGDFMENTLEVRSNPKYNDILTKGSFIPLPVNSNDKDQIIAFARHLNGKTLLVVANRDVNTRQHGSIEVPGLSANQNLTNLFKSYGENSTLQADENRINVDLGPGRIHLFEIDTPDIEKCGLEVMKQKN
jgi:glycosidase